MTSARNKTKPVLFPLDYARTEILIDALTDQRISLLRELRLLRANPHPSPEDSYELSGLENMEALTVAVRAELEIILDKLQE